MTQRKRIAWVTGASGGLGSETAKALVSQGWQVVAGARSFESCEGPGKEGHRLTLDVTNEQSVHRFAKEAHALYGTPDALINAAGLLVLGPAEDLSFEEYQRVMDVNFYGSLRLCKEVLPLMREKGRGRIVNFSSVNGLLATPFEGAYTASKHALEGWTECLRMECAPFGIETMLVEPGDHRGGSKAYRPHAKTISPCYQSAFDRGTGVIARDEEGGSCPQKLGMKVAKVLDRRRLPARLRIAMFSQHAAVILHDLLPSNLFLRILAFYYRLPGTKKPSSTQS